MLLSEYGVVIIHCSQQQKYIYQPSKWMEINTIVIIVDSRDFSLSRVPYKYRMLMKFDHPAPKYDDLAVRNCMIFNYRYFKI
jgi:hypothetical protein